MRRSQRQAERKHSQETIRLQSTNDPIPMVYFDDHKRRGRRSAKKPPKPTPELPDELLLQVLADADTADILKVRVLGHKMLSVCTDALQDRLKTLYVHPKPSSVKRAIAICNSGLAAKVEVICLLGQIPWQTILKTYPEARRSVSVSAKGEELYMFKPWPHTSKPAEPEILHLSGKSKNRVHGPRISRGSFAGSYEIFLHSLDTLPKARCLKFHDRCDQPGFNQSSDADIKSYAMLCAGARAPKDKVPSSLSAESRIRHTDSDAVFAVLSMLDRPSGLYIKDELAYSNPIRLGSGLSHLTSLELHCSTGWDRSAWQTTCAEIVKNAPLLQDLSLKFQHNPAIHEARIETSLETIVASARLLVLRRLELTALLPPMVKDRNWRPILQRFDFADFLTKHSFMTDVTLDNVFFHHGEILDDAQTAFAPILAVTSPVLVLRWIINRFDRDPRCKKKDASAGHTCRYDCFNYCPTGLGDLQLRALDSYMEMQLGQEAENDRQSWDIGSVRDFVLS